MHQYLEIQETMVRQVLGVRQVELVIQDHLEKLVQKESLVQMVRLESGVRQVPQETKAQEGMWVTGGLKVRKDLKVILAIKVQLENLVTSGKLEMRVKEVLMARTDSLE